MLAQIRIVFISNCILLSFTEFHAQTLQKDEKVRERKSRDIAKYMNLAANPCDDFYEFACGNWVNYHSIENENEIITPESVAITTIDKNLENLLSESTKINDNAKDRKIKEFYKSCLTAVRNSATQQSFLSDLVAKYGGFPAVPGSKWNEQNTEYDWKRIVAQLQRDFDFNILIGIHVRSNPIMIQEFSVYLVEPDTIIPPPLCNADVTKDIDVHNDQYEPIEVEVAENLKAWLSLNDGAAKKIAADIISFEFELCTSVTQNESDSSSPLNIYNERKSLYELTKDFNNTIDFMQIVSDSFGSPLQRPVHMKKVEYYKQLIRTISSHNSATIANYIMYRAFSQFIIPPASPPAKRQHFCLTKTKEFFPVFLSDLFWRRYLGHKDDIIEMFQKFKEIMRKSFQNGWINEPYNLLGMNKLNEMQLLLYFNSTDDSENLEWFHIDPKNYWTNIAQLMGQVKRQKLKYLIEKPVENAIKSYETEAVYNTKLKRIEVGGGLLLEPFYHTLYPNSMNYALIGTIIARELVSAFNDLSWKTNALHLPNLLHRTLYEFESRTECFRQQISNYLYNNVHSYQNGTRVRELIARSSSLNVAFNAYLDWLNFKNPNKDKATLKQETLSNINFSNTQLFFITFAQQHCRAGRIETKKKRILSPLDSHNLQRYEVNGPLQNSADFSLDFGCAIGTEMNPVDKCIIY